MLKSPRGRKWLSVIFERKYRGQTRGVYLRIPHYSILCIHLHFAWPFSVIFALIVDTSVLHPQLYPQVYRKCSKKQEIPVKTRKSRSKNEQQKTVVNSAIAVVYNCFLARAEGFEPSAYGFGDRRSTSWAMPVYLLRPSHCVLQGRSCTPNDCKFWCSLNIKTKRFQQVVPLMRIG